jgi:hypothetical protein
MSINNRLINTGAAEPIVYCAPYVISSSTAPTFSPRNVYTGARGIVVRENGAQMWIYHSDGGGYIRNYPLSTPYDTSTWSIGSDFTGIGTNHRSLFVNNAGTRMFNTAGSVIYQWNASSAWNNTTLSYVYQIYPPFSVQGVSLTSDGTKLFAAGSGGSVVYDLSTPFELSSAGTPTVYSAFSADGLYVTDDGRHMTAGYNHPFSYSDSLQQYWLNTPFDFNSKELISQIIINPPSGGVPAANQKDLAFANNGAYVYSVEDSSNYVRPFAINVGSCTAP